METDNDAQTIAKLVTDIEIQFAGNEEPHPFILVPEGMNVHDLEAFLSTPVRIKRSPTFISLESFNRYVNEFKQDGTSIRLSRCGNATAEIDGPSKDQPRWGNHVVAFMITYSERWGLWDARNKKSFTQKEFAEFIEDNTADFLAPRGGDMLDIARDLEIEQSSRFTSAQKDFSTGDVKLSFERTTTAKAGQKDSMAVPLKFTIQIPVLEGEEPRPIDIRLRYELTGEGSLKFSYDILKRQQLLEDVRRSVYATIANATQILPFLV